MHMKHGKVVFGYKDTFSMEDTLRPIIAAGMKKFVETLEAHPDFAGFPVSLASELESQGAITRDPTSWEMSEEDTELCSDYWNDILHEILWAFSTEEPDIGDYDFSYEPNDDHGTPSGNGTRLWSMRCTNEDEHNRYREDEKEYYERVQKGYDLLGKYLRNLWW